MILEFQSHFMEKCILGQTKGDEQGYKIKVLKQLQLNTKMAAETVH